MTGDPSPAQRAAALITGSRFLVLATADAAGPWAATVNHVAGQTGSLLFCSSPRSRHSQHIASRPMIAATAYMVGPGQNPLDGVQLCGRCTPASEDELTRLHREFFVRAYPDTAARDQTHIALRDFGPAAAYQLYTIEITQCWVRDLQARQRERAERRLPVPVPDLVAALRAHSAATEGSKADEQ
ncbi:pyridoxamine 5'-phosphate oxidase family protein [Streptomyces malaysiensis]|uniref:Pyridoxamine 5'-phosphate oxidase family protein n=1 Tax=Streptomyces malaysiensis TaxID=92644 RepID=A0A7X5X9X0_STRMQ|nr:pyridoxamine 5'-phosphate oxidase family protein [Streptomyces malaysiensis]NIY69349.1 pyridoxamine 5'-phosphate oxidase family protein [Streptomyces malaysiensis]